MREMDKELTMADTCVQGSYGTPMLLNVLDFEYVHTGMFLKT